MKQEEVGAEAPAFLYADRIKKDVRWVVLRLE